MNSIYKHYVEVILTHALSEMTAMPVEWRKVTEYYAVWMKIDVWMRMEPTCTYLDLMFFQLKTDFFSVNFEQTFII